MVKIPVEKISFVLACLFLAAITLTIGSQSGAFSGFPKGEEAFYHASLIKIIRDNFPQVFWNPYWNGGEVLFPNYSPLYYFLLALLGWVVPALHLSGETGSHLTGGMISGLMVGTAAFNLTATTLTLFALLYFLSKKILPAFAGAIFFLSSVAIWPALVKGGLYLGIFSQTTFTLAILALLFYFKRILEVEPPLKIPLRGSTSKGSDAEGGWPYYFVVLTFAAVFLSQFWAAVFLVFSFFIFLFLFFPRFDDRFVLSVKVLVPIAGLASFFYLPQIVWGTLGVTGLSGTLPRLPSLIWLLFAVLILVIFFTRHKMEGEVLKTWKIFWLSGFLALPALLNNSFFLNFFLPASLFLAIFVGLGFYFISSFKILTSHVLLIIIVGFVALSLYQIPSLERTAVDKSRVWPRLDFKALDEERLFRFAIGDKWLAGAFNFYSSTLQTPETDFSPFSLDWHGVKGLHLGVSELGLKPENFAQVGPGEWVYKNASPLLLATNTPVVLVEAEEKEYRKILEGLSGRGASSGIVIPLRVEKDERVEKKDLPQVTSWEEMEKILEGFSGGPTLVRQVAELEGKFVHSQRREIKSQAKQSGVLLKEHYFPNWTATTEYTENGGKTRKEKLKIYPAGPGMMYVFLPQEYGIPAKVIFEYRLSLIEKLGYLISLTTLILIILSWLGVDWQRRLVKVVRIWLN